MDIKKFFLDEKATILEAMKRLDETAVKVLFVQKDGILKAALSDGDVRRWILAHGALDAEIKHAANYKPLYLKKDNAVSAPEFLKKNSIEAVPIVDNELKILDVILWDERKEIYIKQKINLPVVIMAGGKGTRLYPYTKILPKPLIPVGEVPIAEHIINQFRDYGCFDYFMIVNHKKNMIKAYFNEIEKDYNVYYADEEKPLGTGGGLSLLQGRIHKTFILTNCDILIRENIAKIYHHHKKQNNLITMVCSLKNYQVPYGVVEIGEDGSVQEMREKPQLSFFTNTGCYIVESRVIDELENDKPISFPGIMEKYMRQGEKIGVYPIGEHTWLDMGQLDGLEKMQSIFS